MSKFIRIPITGEAVGQLISIEGKIAVTQASTTTTTIAYVGGKIVTVTHAAQPAGNETTRNEIDSAMTLLAGNKHLNLSVLTPTYAVSGIAIA